VVADLRREVEARAPAERPAVVQVASTPDSAEAQRIVARLRASGFDAFSVAVQPNGTTTHRVRVRTPRDQTPAAVAEKLRAQGFDTWITRD
jgi:cell division septation protein DedD